MLCCRDEIEIIARTRSFNGNLWGTVEEVSELLKELAKHNRGKGNIDNIKKELVDVQIMLEIVAMEFGISELDYIEALACKMDSNLLRAGYDE